MSITAPSELDLSGSRFYQNRAEFGGAVSLTSTKEETRDFNDAYFEKNEATDGGALYLYTGAGKAAVKNAHFVRNYARETSRTVPEQARFRAQHSTAEINLFFDPSLLQPMQQ